MKYFTRQLFERLNRGNASQMAKAANEWELAIEKYRDHLKSIAVKLPPLARAFSSDYSFHDAQLLAISTSGINGLAVMLRQGSLLQVLNYRLADKPHVIQSPNSDCFSSEGVHWLYDEIELGTKGGAVHSVLLSDGSELLVPFVDLAVSSFSIHPVRGKLLAASGGKKGFRGSKKTSLGPGPLAYSRPALSAAQLDEISVSDPAFADLSVLDHLKPIPPFQSASGGTSNSIDFYMGLIKVGDLSSQRVSRS